MPLSTPTNRALYAPAAGVTAFSFNNKFYSGNPASPAYDLTVAVYNSSGILITSPAQPVFGTDYNISGTLTNGVYESGGSVNFTVPPYTTYGSGCQLLLLRVEPLTQTTQFPISSSFDPNTLTQAFDKQTMITQQLSEQIGRAILQGPFNPIVNLTLPPPSANQSIVWDPTGTTLVNGPTSAQISSAASNAASAAASAAAAAASAASLSNVLTVANVRTYGAVGNGSTDDTTAILAAISSLTSGGIVYFPPGTYKYSTLGTIPSSVTLQGAGRSASTLSCSSTTATGMTMGISSGIKDIQLSSSVTRTANPYVDIQVNAVLVQRVSVANYFQGIQIGTIGGAQPAVVRITDVNFVSPVTGAGSYAIFGRYWSTLILEDITGAGPSTGTQPDYGIRLLAGDTCFMSHVNITKHGIALCINPASGSSCFAVTGNNCSFDNAGTTSGGSASSCVISPAGGVYDSKFTNTWFGYAAAFGCAIQPTGSGIVDGFQLSNSELVNNADGGIIWGNSGSATVKNVVITGGSLAANTNTAIRFYGGASGVTITGNRVGPYAGRGANGYGIVIDGGSASSDVLIAANNVIGNTTANISDGATGSNVQIYSNNGYNSVAALAAITPPASTVAYTAGHTPEVHYIRGGTVTSVTQDSVQIFTASPATVSLAPNESYAITYSVVPTVTKKLL